VVLVFLCILLSCLVLPVIGGIAWLKYCLASCLSWCEHKQHLVKNSKWGILFVDKKKFAVNIFGWQNHLCHISALLWHCWLNGCLCLSLPLVVAGMVLTAVCLSVLRRITQKVKCGFFYSTPQCERRNARIASAVLATAILSIRLSHAGIVSKLSDSKMCLVF